MAATLLIYNLGLLFLAATESTFPIQRTTNVKLVLFKGELNDRQSQLDFTAYQEITGDKNLLKFGEQIYASRTRDDLIGVYMI